MAVKDSIIPAGARFLAGHSVAGLRRSTVGYGRRWTVEIVISAIKRMFGEDLMALKWPNMVREVMLRVALYNRWIGEAAA